MADNKNSQESDSEATRRSFRLRDKPQPAYDFKHFLKKEISILEKSKPVVKIPVPPEVTNKKYDDIFDAVVADAYKKCVNEKMFRKQARSQANLKRISICEIESSPDDSNSDDDIICEKIISPSAKQPRISTIKCTCGEGFITHDECHRHIIQDHNENEIIVNCCECKQDSIQIYKNYVCTVCGEYASNLRDHLASHYRSSTSRTAVMECRFCVKQFLTVPEVMKHEKEKHLTKNLKKQTLSFPCLECSTTFPSQESLLSHYSSHFNLNEIWEQVANLQLKSQLGKENCPFCNFIITSRKTFKAHVIRNHFTECKSFVTKKEENLKSDIEIKQEVMEMFDDVIQSNNDVKQEVIDEEYPNS